MKRIFGKRIIPFLLIIVVLLIIIGKKYYCFSLKEFGYNILIRSREAIASIFVFGNYDKANWNMIIAKKRLKESEKNPSIKCQRRNIILLSDSTSHFEKFYYFYNISKNSGEDVNYFIPESIDYFNRIKVQTSSFDKKYSVVFNSKLSIIKNIETKMTIK